MNTSEDTDQGKTMLDRRDARPTSTGDLNSPAGEALPETADTLTQGQEGYPGPREPGNAEPVDRDAEVNNAQTPLAGDTDPSSTASSDATGQAGVNDRPGKDQAHPWNG